jgi:hypothetical protein
MKYGILALRVCAALLLLGGVGLLPVGAQNHPVHAAAQAPSTALSNFQVLPASVIGGNTTFGTLTFTNPTPRGGVNVTIHSSSPAAQSFRSLHIPAGVTTYHFVIDTFRVPSDVDVTLSATYNGVTLNAPLTVEATPAILYGIYTNTHSATGGAGDQTGTVVLNGKAPEGGAVVALSSDNAAITVPESVTIPAGQRSATFTFTPNVVMADTSVNLSATYNGVTKFTHFFVRVIVPPTIAAVSAADVQAGANGMLQITLTGPAPYDMQVAIVANPSSDITIPSTATVLSGHTTLQVPFQAGMVARPTLVRITVTVGNSSSTTSIVVSPAPS